MTAGGPVPDALARWRERLSGRRRQQGYVAVGLVSSFALVAGLGVAGAGASSTAVHLLSGSGWLANTSTGTVSHVNGYSGQVDATVKSGVKAGDPFTVVQRGDGAYIVDQRTGAISAIGGASQTRGRSVDPAIGGPRVQVVVGHGRTYLVDRSKGVVQQVDPHSLQPRGPKASLGGRIGDTVVDADGTLWATLPGKARVAAVGPDHHRRTAPVGHRGDVIALAAPHSGVIAVDVTAGHTQAVSGSAPPAHFRADRSARRADAAASHDTVVAAAGHHVTTVTGSAAHQLTLPCTAADVVAHGRWAHVRCRDGGMHRVDLQTHRATSEPGPAGGADELTTAGGVPFANNTTNSSAVAYHGRHHVEINKYDAAKARAKRKKASKHADRARAHQPRHGEKHQHKAEPPHAKHASQHHHPAKSHDPASTPSSSPGPEPSSDPETSPGREPSPDPTEPSEPAGSSAPCPPGKMLAADGGCADGTTAPPSTAPPSTPPPSTAPPAASAPGTPGQVTAAGDAEPGATTATVTVAWQQQGTVDSFFVVDVAHPDQQSRTVAGNVHQAAFTVPAGNGPRKYCFKVQAKRGPQTSSYSSPACATVQRAVTKPSKPRHLKVSATRHKITATWKAPKHDGGAKIAGYTVQISGRKAHTVTGTSRSFSKLDPGTSYTVTVSATNAAGKTGSARHSSITTKKPKPKPKPPARAKVYRCQADNGANAYTFSVGGPCTSTGNWKHAHHVFNAIRASGSAPAKGMVKLRFWNFINHVDPAQRAHSVRWCRGTCGKSGEWETASSAIWVWTSKPAGHFKATKIKEYVWKGYYYYAPAGAGMPSGYRPTGKAYWE
jgi:hypothetical protein